MENINKENQNSSSVNYGYKYGQSMGAYLDQKLQEIPEDKKNVFIEVGNVIVNCCVGNTKVSIDDFVSDLCKLELRI